MSLYPLRISKNGRYFVDQVGVPVFWMGTTQWQLVRDNSFEEAALILDKSVEHGFSFAQVMLLGPGLEEPSVGATPNVDGELPWVDGDPAQPNEAYFRHVDGVLDVARQKNVVISLTVFHQHQQEIITVRNARVWARWIAHRYRDVPTIVWSTTPHAEPESAPVLRELMAGLREGDGGAHLITCKPDPGPYSSSFIHQEPALDFNSIQTYTWPERIYPLVTTDYQLEPVKPVLMAEGAYEQGVVASCYDFEVTPLWIRRQAYYSYLAGAHHTYGNYDLDHWGVSDSWRAALESPGAAQLGALRRIFEEREEWWNLVPDPSILTSGGQLEGRVLTLAARHASGRWALVYCGAKSTFTVDLSKIAGKQVEAFWIDPRSGERSVIGESQTQGTATFSTPRDWGDALLVLEARP